VRFDVLVEVQLRPGIADPEGATIERALPALGFTGVHSLRVGRAIRFEVDADDEPAAGEIADQLASRLLANPVIERASVQVSSGDVTVGVSSDSGHGTSGHGTDSAAGNIANTQ
jgi:phosphoribosylformylglycinamidine synthase subunit PurS